MLKPVGYATFAQRLSRALGRMRRRERTYITVPIKGGAMKLAVEDITFVESQGHRLIYHTARRSTSAPGPSRTRRRSWRATTSSAATRAIS